MYNPNVRQFKKYVAQECEAYGIKLVLHPRKYAVLPGNIKCSGYFDCEDKVLLVAIKRKDWLSILVHEFAHLTQWAENCKAWRNSWEGNDLDEWLQGKEIKDPKKTLAVCRDLELDNEKRAVKLIKKWNLPIDIKTYTQKANAYVQFYNYMFFTRRWCNPKNSPYRNPAIYGQMPTRFRMNYKTISPKYKKIFEDCGV